ncbi:Ptm1p [Sugiyamaella lignohabitans]|uniref:Ptm1p n=1 Tax=Sugiyamaella lignohabitans TaxID=796027 RepID=A0A167F371_9ASCO|nr:Ptm1p [Sugiyamaella lignohabitans]ANB14766.1 Ptm1p [Sugiyamaella lignohabitans]
MFYRSYSRGQVNVVWLIVLISTVFGSVWADEVKVDNNKDNRQICSGIYSKQDWSGPHDSYIDAAFTSPSDNENDWIAVVIFEYRNVDMLGVSVSGDRNKKYVCDEGAIASGLCKSEQLGTFLIDENLGDGNHTSDLSGEQNIPALFATISTQRVDAKNPKAIHYPIKKSGYYCVTTFPSNPDLKYTGAVVYQNAFGYLAAGQIPKLPFFGGAALAYLVVFALWMFSYIQHRSDILPVQNYITAICGFLVIEMIIIWGYYDLVNSKGTSGGTVAYLVFLSILDALRNAYTFFLLLIVCLGYGVVKPSLGSVMWKCQALGVAHFVFAVIYTVSSYLLPTEAVDNPLVLLVILPLTLTMTVFYVWILSSLTGTIKYLESHKQHVKANMYKNLWRILLGSIIVIFAFFFINSLILAGESTLDFITKHWESRWFILDGWLNVVYFVNFCLVAFIWRPTANNRRFAMSSQLAQNEEEAQEFEIGSLRESIDDEEQQRTRDVSPREGGTTIRDFAPPSDNQPDDDRPAAAKYFDRSSSTIKKDTLAANDGETMFDVGGDDDEDDDAAATAATLNSGAGVVGSSSASTTNHDRKFDDDYDQWNDDDEDLHGDLLSDDEDEDDDDDDEQRALTSNKNK